MTAAQINEIIDRYIGETQATAVDESIGQLTRGKCAIRDYFIFKIDIVSSTSVLYARKAPNYVRLMHPFYSALDQICRTHGADEQQTEYHGDSVLALFPKRGISAGSVLTAAVECHFAFRTLIHKSTWLEAQHLQTRAVLHFGSLAVAMTGPYNESHRIVVGIPIHVAAKREKLVAVGSIWASDDFAKEIDAPNRARLFTEVTRTETRQEYVDEHGKSPPPIKPGARGLLGYGAKQQLSDILAARFAQIPPPNYQNRNVQRTVNDGWSVRIPTCFEALGLPLNVLAPPIRR